MCRIEPLAPEQLPEVSKVSRTVQEHLADLARENPVSEKQEKTSSAVGGGVFDRCRSELGEQIPTTHCSFLLYFDHYLTNNASCIILGADLWQERE